MSRLNTIAFELLLFMAVLVGSAVQTRAIPVTGILNITGSVTLTSTTLDFLPPSGPPNGQFLIGFGNTGDFGGSSGSMGTIRDIISAPGTAQPTFLTFAANPLIAFDLLAVNAGTFSSAQCGAPAAPGQTCTPAGSIYNFSNNTSTSSSVSFTVQGNMRNLGTNELTPYTGIFSMQFATQNYQQLLALLASGGVVTTTYSASFGQTVPPPQVPEPATMLLMGTGLAGVTAVIRKMRKLGKRADL